MKKIISIVMSLSFVTLLFAGCTTSEINIGHNEETPAQPPEVQVEQPPETTDPEHHFVLNINNTLIPLQAWDHDVDLEGLLGKPISQEVVELGSGSNTLSGSFVKKLNYDGLQFELFSPKQNGGSFWIMTMAVTKEGYKSSEGIEIGDSVEDLKNAYPDIAIALDGRTDPNNCAYEITDEGQYNVLRFEVNNGLVHEIKIYHLIP